MSKSLYQVRAYNVKHGYDINSFLEAYRLLLQRAVDEIWAKIKWVEKPNKNGRKRTIPIIPKEGSFRHHYLRSILMNDWNYSKHYVDSAIKQAYSILKSWRRGYVKGKRSGNKPTVKKKFARIKETLYSYRDGIIKVSVKPFNEYLGFDVSKAWFWTRVPKDADMGELILNERYLTVTFRFKRKASQKEGIAWDCNERSLDGFNPKLGWIRVDLTRLFHIHRVYELKRKRLQSLVSRKPSLNKVLTEYSRREKDRAKDFMQKLTAFLSRRYEG
ncbi:MAG: transposase, partial [Candidatus Methanomethyliales bacterium]|nr:transposase [Candidatus Methanomethylicales archaeon]